MALETVTRPGIHLTAAPAELATRPSQLRFEHGRHMYFDGKRWLPSVTGIIKRGGESQDGLLIWHADTTAACAIEEAAELSRLRRLDGDNVAYEWLRKAPDRKRDRATVSGSDLHDIADRMLSGAEVPEHLHEDVTAMAGHVVSFMRDFRVQVLYSEVRLCNRAMGYCGTADQIGIVPEFGDRPIVIDWKTSASMYEKPKFSHAKNAMQLAPYSRAEAMFWDDRTEADMIEVSREVGLIVMIRPEGYKVQPYALAPAWPQFERAFASYHWWRETDQLTLGPVRMPPDEVIARATGELAVAGLIEQSHTFAGQVFDTVNSAHATRQILERIRRAGSQQELLDLRTANAHLWNEELNAAGGVRFAELGRVAS